MNYEPALTLVEREVILEQTDPVDRFMAVWQVILARHGINLADVPPGGITAADYRLPKESATWAAEAVIAATPTEHRTALAMEWANKGPGYYEEGEQQ